jgi:hypothetical protein
MDEDEMDEDEMDEDEMDEDGMDEGIKRSFQSVRPGEEARGRPASPP